MGVTRQDIQHALRSLRLAGQPICVHSSLRSFGHVDGGAGEVVDAFLSEGTTLLVPAFSFSFLVPAPPGARPARNGWRYDRYPGPTTGIGRCFTPACQDIDPDMGAIPAAVLARPQRCRGDHPLCSFAALGSLSAMLTSGQKPLNVYAPLTALAEGGGFVLLIGVDLTSMTLLHLAERLAGRNLFRRWANDKEAKPMQVEIGGCASGFENLRPHLEPLMRKATVGLSNWIACRASDILSVAAAIIRANPNITHCGNADCERCADAVAGGPILS